VDTVAHYVSSVMPFLWWPVAVVGAWALYRRRSLSVALVTMGSAVLATVGTLHQVFGYSAAFDAEGKLLTESPGLLSLGAALVWSGVGLLCLVVGLLLLLWRGTATERDA
jgi:hypothetical protein